MNKNNNMNHKELFDILNEALDRAMAGESVEKILADYPRYAAEIGPLLRTAVDTHHAAMIKPRPEFRDRAALEFQRAIQNMPVKAKAAQPARRWRLSLVAPLAALLVVLLAGTGTVTAASFSLPGDALYRVKLATESVQVALTPSDLGKAELYAKFNDRRVDELVRVADKGMVAEIDVLNSRIAGNLDTINQLTGNENMLASGAPEMKTFGTAAMPEETTPAARSPLPDNPPAPVTTATTTTTVIPTVTTVVTVPPDADTSRSQDAVSESPANNKNVSRDKEQKLHELLSEKQLQNLDALLKSYARASESVKPRILETIRLIVHGYGLTVDNEPTIIGLLEKYGLTIADLF